MAQKSMFEAIGARNFKNLLLGMFGFELIVENRCSAGWIWYVARLSQQMI